MNSDHLQPLLTAIKALVNSNTGEEAMKTIQQHPELLSKEADKVFEAWIEQQTSDKVRAFLQSHRQALQQLRQARKNEGIPAGRLRPLLTAIQTLINSNTSEEATKTIQQHPELLSEEIDEVFEALIEQQASDDARAILRSYRQGLQQLRQTGKNPGIALHFIAPHFQADLDQAESAEARYLQTGDLAALDESIAAWERILQHPDFATVDAKFRARVLNNSSSTYSLRYQARGELSDLNRALSDWQTIITTTPPESPYLPGLLNNQGNGLTYRYAHTGNLTDLQAGIAAHQQAVQLTPKGSPDLPGFLNNLGNGLKERYAHTGDLSDLQKAIAAYQQAVPLTPKDSPNLPFFLNNLGNGLRDYYTHTGDLTNLQTGIVAYQRAVRLTPKDSPDLPIRLNNLGDGLRDRYARTGDLIDLQAGIAVYQRVVQLTPEGSPDLSKFLNNRDIDLIRYAQMSDLTDLPARIEYLQQAMQLIPKDSPDSPSLLMSTDLTRYAQTSDLTGLQAWIAAYQQAVQLTPKGSPDLPSRLNNQGNGLKALSTHTGNRSDLPAGMAAKTIMVVDDSPTIRRVVEIFLKRQGMEVLTAKDGVDAVAQLREHVPDLILLDEEMPQMDGYELATQIRNTTEWKHIPIIMITSSTEAKHRDRAKTIGINRYVGKPFTITELLENVNALLNTQ
jgi:CheY-like chemotaxis protein